MSIRKLITLKSGKNALNFLKSSKRRSKEILRCSQSLEKGLDKINKNIYEILFDILFRNFRIRLLLLLFQLNHQHILLF